MLTAVFGRAIFEALSALRVGPMPGGIGTDASVKPVAIVNVSDPSGLPEVAVFWPFVKDEDEEEPQTPPQEDGSEGEGNSLALMPGVAIWRSESSQQYEQEESGARTPEQLATKSPSSLSSLRLRLWPMSGSYWYPTDYGHFQSRSVAGIGDALKTMLAATLTYVSLSMAVWTSDSSVHDLLLAQGYHIARVIANGR